METTCVVQIPCQICQQVDAVSEMVKHKLTGEAGNLAGVFEKQSKGLLSLLCLWMSHISRLFQKKRGGGDRIHLFVPLEDIQKEIYLVQLWPADKWTHSQRMSSRT